MVVIVSGMPPFGCSSVYWFVFSCIFDRYSVFSSSVSVFILPNGIRVDFDDFPIIVIVIGTIIDVCRCGVDFGFVGDVDKANGQMLSKLIEEGITPVMAPLTHDGQGNILNTNADTIASETAKALAPYYDVTLIFSFEKKGVLRNPDDDDSVIPVITRADFINYKADSTISGGMLPKIENALGAIDSGVSRVIITLATALDGQSGTIIQQ